MSAGHVTASGNKIVLSDDGSYIEDKQTGERMYLEAKDEAYPSFVNAKERVVEIAESKEFCPSVALAPENNCQREARLAA